MDINVSVLFAEQKGIIHCLQVFVTEWQKLLMFAHPLLHEELAQRVTMGFSPELERRLADIYQRLESKVDFSKIKINFKLKDK